jgi:hypothetical protein
VRNVYGDMTVSVNAVKGGLGMSVMVVVVWSTCQVLVTLALQWWQKMRECFKWCVKSDTLRSGKCVREWE